MGHGSRAGQIVSIRIVSERGGNVEDVIADMYVTGDYETVHSILDPDHEAVYWEMFRWTLFFLRQ